MTNLPATEIARYYRKCKIHNLYSLHVAPIADNFINTELIEEHSNPPNLNSFFSFPCRKFYTYTNRQSRFHSSRRKEDIFNIFEQQRGIRYECA